MRAFSPRYGENNEGHAQRFLSCLQDWNPLDP